MIAGEKAAIAETGFAGDRMSPLSPGRGNIYARLCNQASGMRGFGPPLRGK